MGDRILLVGATGTTGTALGRALHERGIGFRALVRDPAAAQALMPPGAELVAGDLGDTASLAAACRGVDRMYLAHAVHPDLRSWCRNVYTAAKDAGVHHVVRLSAMNADPDSAVRLLQLHGLADEDLRASGLGWTILRPNAFMQNLLAQAPVIAGSDCFYLPAGDATQSLIDVRDIARATAVILGDVTAHAQASYTLTGPEALSYFDVARALSERLGRPVSYVPVREEDSVQALLGAGLPEWNARVIAELQAGFAGGGFARVTDTVSRITGQPALGISAFLADAAPAFGAA